MQKVWCIVFGAVIAIPVMGMNNEYRMVNFMGDFSAITIPESRLQLMGLWPNHYKKYKNTVEKGGLVPLFENISSTTLSLVDDALKVGPYNFAQYYNNLSKVDQQSLILASGIYGEKGKTLMLHIPELTKQLLEVYFDADLRGQILKYNKNNDADQVMNYFRARLIESKALLSVMRRRVPIVQTLSTCLQEKIVHRGAFFLNGNHTNKYSYLADNADDYKIPLRIGPKKHDTYATHFITDTYEFRITDLQDRTCNLWIVDHNNINDPSYTFSYPIKHTSAIKGCVFSKTGTGIEYVVTYSENEINLLKMSTYNDVSCIETKIIMSFKKGVIIDVCFDVFYDFLIVATHEKMQSVVRRYDMDGKLVHEATFNFKQYGLLKKVFTFKKHDIHLLTLLFGIADLYAVRWYQRQDDGNYILSGSQELQRKIDGNKIYSTYGQILDWENSLFLYSFQNTLFEDIVLDETNKMKNQTLISYLTEDIVKRFDGETYRIYSPDGKLLLCNSVILRNNVFRIETVLKDAVNHTDIAAFDTVYNDFRGVGFTPDSTGLIFFNPINMLNQEASRATLLTEEDYVVLDALENVACKNIGIASLLNRLCIKYKRHGQLALLKDDSTRIMLRDWAIKFPLLTQLLQKYLPFYTVETELSNKGV